MDTSDLLAMHTTPREHVPARFAIIIVVAALLAACGGAIAPGGSTSRSNAPVTAHPTGQLWSTPATLSPSFTAPAKLTAADIATVQQILTASTQHYESAFAVGKVALGTKQYPNAATGLDALNDPTSNARRFSSWRTSTGIENDLTFLDAFTQADAYYTADNEPAGIGNWRNDMSDATAALNEWVQAAVSWQISEVSTGALTAAEAKVTAGFKTVQADIAATVAGR